MTKKTPLSETEHWWTIFNNDRKFIEYLRATYDVHRIFLHGFLSPHVDQFRTDPEWIERGRQRQAFEDDFAEYLNQTFGYEFPLPSFIEMAEKAVDEVASFQELEARIKGGEDWQQIAERIGYDEEMSRDDFIMFLRRQFDTIQEAVSLFRSQSLFFAKVCHHYEQEDEPDEFTAEALEGISGVHPIGQDGTIVCPACAHKFLTDKGPADIDRRGYRAE